MVVLAEGAAGKPQLVAGAEEAAITLPRTEGDGKVRINGARVVGSTPGRPFVFKVPVTGVVKPFFTATGLPAGLKMDTATGIISGTLERAGATVMRADRRGGIAGR